jgi:hypothetical protein
MIQGVFFLAHDDNQAFRQTFEEWLFQTFIFFALILP